MRQECRDAYQSTIPSVNKRECDNFWRWRQAQCSVSASAFFLIRYCHLKGTVSNVLRLFNRKEGYLYS